MKQKAEYDISIVVFFDILGFGDTVEKAKEPAQVLEILKTLTYQSRPDKELASMYEQRFSNFSDTIVRTTNILSKTNKEYQIGILFHELLDLIYIQCSLIHYHDILIRGSVTIDRIYIDGSFVFGPGLNRAYSLGKNLAIYPRIVIDRRVFTILEKTPLLKASHHNLALEKDYIRSLIRESSDGIWFLDYLRAIESEMDDPQEYGEFLRHHKELILKCSKDFEDLDNISVKYAWLAKYHNEIIQSMSNKEFKSIGISRNKLYITKNQVRTIYEF